MKCLITVAALYIAIGLCMMTHVYRGWEIRASLKEWLVIVFLWPWMLKLFASFESVQQSLKRLEEWENAYKAANGLERCPECDGDTYIDTVRHNGLGLTDIGERVQCWVCHGDGVVEASDEAE